MISFVLATAVSTTFTIYPGFVAPKSQIETVRDLGPVLELVVKCPGGSGIMSFSKIEKTFCTPGWKCYRELEPALHSTCN